MIEKETFNQEQGLTRIEIDNNIKYKKKYNTKYFG